MNSIFWDDRASLPRRPGIYYVYAGRGCFRRRLLYIGISKNLQERWSDNFGHGEHHKAVQLASLGATRIEYRIIENERLLRHEEAVEIAKYRPPLNSRMETPDRWLALNDKLSELLMDALWIAIGGLLIFRYLLPALLDSLAGG
jgi:excinuclease UvrABC nuclease subunit